MDCITAIMHTIPHVCSNGKGKRLLFRKNPFPAQALKASHSSEFIEWKATVKEPGEPQSPLFGRLHCRKWEHYGPDALQYQFKEALKDVGIAEDRYSIHCCRHTALTYLYQRTKNLRLVQDIAGHSSPTITAHYAAIVNGWKALEEAGEAGLYE